MYNRKHNIKNKFLEHRDDLYCRFCGKQCRNLNSLAQHEIRCTSNPQRILAAESNLSNRGWAKGLNKNTDARIKHQSESRKNYYKTHSGTFKGKHHTEKTKKKMSEAHLNIDHANCNHNSHGKRGYKDNMFFMSSYELAYYLYIKLTSPDVIIERCPRRYKYFYKGKSHYYTPDFIVNNIHIVEIKGWETPLDRYKYTLVPDIIVLKHDDIIPMIKAVKEHYGVDDICSLYDKRCGK